MVSVVSHRLLLVFLFSFNLLVGQNFSDPFYKYGFPQDEIYIDIDKALKNSKEVRKLKLIDIDLSLNLKALEKFNSLNVLELQNNKIDSLPEGIYDNQSLSYFSCSGNSILKLSENIQFWSRLRELKLYNTNLDSFPTTFSSLSRLERIEFQSNTADTFRVNNSFSNLPNLEELLFYRVVLSNFPKNISTSQQLKNLYLVHSQISEIDSSLYKCEGLKVLVLEGNKINRIDKRILNLSKLEVLSFKNNELKNVPEYISKLKDLKTLDLLGNPIPRYQVEILRILMSNCTILF